MIELSAYKFAGPGGTGGAPWVHVAPLPDVFRGTFRDPATAGEAYAAAVGAIVDRVAGEGRGVCAFLAESSPSVGGQIVLPPGYLSHAYDHVRRGGGVCIADEVQTAYGRIGTHFYAFEAHDVVPDIVVLGKPIGNGYPLGAVVTTRAIADSFDNGMEFFSTFGGSTAACAAGCAVLDVALGEELPAHARRVGTRLLGRLRELAARHPLVGDVRGSGFFLGVELVTDRTTRAPAPLHADYVSNRLREMGVLIGTDGPDHNVLKIRPPMPFDDEDADTLATALEAALAELA
jgi:4-aminobutyrate aminotransferase-like enzyme